MSVSKAAEGLSKHNTGQTGEALVAAEFARRGYTVALPTGNARDIDILAYRNGRRVAVQVKAISKGALQVNMSKFLKVVYEDETGKQIVEGRRSDLDLDICFVIVFLGDRLGKDRFYCGTLGDFVDALEAHHVGYLEKNGGMRPGKNKKSLHAAMTENQIRESGKFKRLEEFLTSLNEAGKAT